MTDQPIFLTEAEIIAITGLRARARQLDELRRQGYWRATANAAGGIILPRCHFEAVNLGAMSTPSAGAAEPKRPQVQPAAPSSARRRPQAPPPR